VSPSSATEGSSNPKNSSRGLTPPPAKTRAPPLRRLGEGEAMN
jgi:hypothetical protein